MNLPQFALTHKSMVVTLVTIIAAIGTHNFLNMPRREDPEITVRFATITTTWAGAPANRVEELITDPIETAVAAIPEVDRITSRSSSGQSVVSVFLEDDVRKPEQIWDDVRAKVSTTQGQLPEGVDPPVVDSDHGDVYAIVLALHQIPSRGEKNIDRRYSPRELEVFAEGIKDQLELLDDVARIAFWGHRPERIYVEIDSADWARVNLNVPQLRTLFESRNIVKPGGQLDTATGSYAINPTGQFTSVDQMKDLIVARVEGNLPVRLADLPFRIDRRYQEPPRVLTRFSDPGHMSQPALVLGITMKSGRNLVQMGQAVDKTLAELKSRILPPDLELTTINDLPRQVNQRIGQFQISLLQGIVIVLVAAVLLMGWRAALIMGATVPISMISTFAVVRYVGIELEQFSVASLIIALGLVVDNAIVVSENAVRLMRAGMPKQDAIIRGPRELTVPLLTSTLTTIFAFLPILTIYGNVGEYVSSLPVVVAVTLLMSFLIAMLVVPIMCQWLLNETRPEPADATAPRAVGFYTRFMNGCLRQQALTLSAAFIMFVASLSLLPVIGTQFFPEGQRDQFFIRVWLPEGSPIAMTAKVTRRIEQTILAKSPTVVNGKQVQRLANVTTFVGSGGPRLLLTQYVESDTPYFAYLLVNTTDPELTRPYAREIREALAEEHEARVAVQLFVLGPPVRDPVAFRLSGPDHDLLRSKAREMVAIFQRTPGTKDVYSDWGTTGYQVEVRVDPYAANLSGVTNADVALTTHSLLSGARLTTYREGDHQVPVVLRTLREHRQGVNDLSGIFVSGQFGKVPLNAIAKVVPSWEPAVTHRRNNLPTVTVASQVEEGVLPNKVSARIKKDLDQMFQALPPGYRLAQGGEHEETTDAQRQVTAAIITAMVLIVLTLVVQFNSILKPLIILFTLPLALIGALIGLYLTGWALGFMAMLGILALMGIVINNAIVLIDFIERRVAEGQRLRSAVVVAGRLRFRPIILTSLTTIGGLLPLSLFGGPLWAPMTNAMIFGLIIATFLTLIIIPTLYVFFVEKFGMKVVD